MSNATGAPPDEPSLLAWGELFDRNTIDALMARKASGGWLDMRYHGLGDGWVEMALPWREELTADASGVLASGPIVSLLDNALGIAVWLKRGVLIPLATVDMRIDYMRPARAGRTVIARAECYRVTRSIAFTRGIAYDEDAADPVAHVTATFMPVAA